MDNPTAAALLISLLERIRTDKTIGSVSSLERTALEQAIRALGHEPPVESAPTTFRAPSTPSFASVDLVLKSLDITEPSDPGVLLCLDFGTAMSKAFAAVDADGYLDLELGTAAGRQGYTLPSSVFIADDGKAYFGFEAIDMSQEVVEAGRERLDSIKDWLNVRGQLPNLDGEACILRPSLNPVAECRLTQGDLLRVYLAYLTDMAGTALSSFETDGKLVGRYAKRRFARPCWPNPQQEKWAEPLMRTMLAEAQILADTFSDRWSGGIDVRQLKDAVDRVRKLDTRPDYLIDVGVPEPVAVAAGAIADAYNLRDGFMVVDAGAGTTDFGLFIATRTSDDEDAPPKVFQVPESIQGLGLAGNQVDRLLRGFILKRESIDHMDIAGSVVSADLGRQIRDLKERLFTAGHIEYVLSNGTVGNLTLEEFRADDTVERFSKSVADGLRNCSIVWMNCSALPSVALSASHNCLVMLRIGMWTQAPDSASMARSRAGSSLPMEGEISIIRSARASVSVSDS